MPVSSYNIDEINDPLFVMLHLMRFVIIQVRMCHRTILPQCLYMRTLRTHCEIPVQVTQTLKELLMKVEPQTAISEP